MRYVLVSDAEHRGGAGIAAGRLASALAARGHEVHWVSARPDGRAHAWRSVPFRPSGPRRVLNRLAQRGPAAVRWRLHEALVTRPLGQVLDALAPDVVNIHNVHGARWQVGVADAVPPLVRLLWTLHDMWTFTGRCAYAYDCRQFLDGCTATCPTPDEYPTLDPSRIAAAWAARAGVLRQRPAATAVAPSRWMAREARAGLWRDHAVVHIPNGVPADTYFPLPRHVGREALGLDRRDRVVVVMAERLGERRKGWAYLHAALARLKAPALRVLLVGEGASQVDVPPPHRALALGQVDDVARQREILSAAEVLVHPAPVDNLPNVVLEAMACGLPTVAFAVGGLPDMVQTGVNGWLAPVVSPEALSDTLATALDAVGGAEASRISAACREIATTAYDPDVQAGRYESLVRDGVVDRVDPVVSGRDAGGGGQPPTSDDRIGPAT